LLPAPGGDPRTLSPEQIAAALQAQVGEIDQVPPAFSLTKVEGRELYRYALAGEEITAAPKRVSIHGIDVLEDDPAADVAAALPPDGRLDAAAVSGRPLRRVRIHVLCSGGVYVRSIARDAGALLGCGGALGRLVRTRVGPFTLDAALTLDEVAARLEQGANPAQLLQPLSCIAPADASVPLDSSQLALVVSGRSIRRFSQQLPAQARRGAVVYGLSGGPEGDRKLAAILTVGEANPQGLVELRPSKVLIRRPG
jgi:tRNA pseudouridine55 synthase